MDFAGKKVLVVGMGLSGQAAVQLLLDKGAEVRATDLNPLDAETAGTLAAAGVPFRLQSPEVFEDVDCIVISPGVAADLEPLEAARARGVRVIGEVELAGYYLKGKTIGITGSNGKTTTTALVGHILKESGIPVQVGGNIGAAPTGMVATSGEGRWNVLELSSFQLETTERFRAHIGVTLNVTPDHLDRHRTFEAYAAAKGRLYATQTAEDFAVLNAEDSICLDYAALTRGKLLWFSTKRPVEPGAYLSEGKLFLGGEPYLEAREIPLRGLHNVENTLAASTAAWLAGASPAAIAAAVRTFPGVEHRLEFVRRIGGVDFYNDSKATNVDATMKALEAFDSPLWVILGGKDKDSDYTTLRELLGRKARAVLLIGAAAQKIESHLSGAVPLIHCGTLDAAVETAYSKAVPGDTVLLAPACASFDQFQSYGHRGRVFKDLVTRLGEPAAGEESK